ncbi:MAG: hypothetical protein ABIT08_15915 [Bacteroidia bacterium]
MNNQTLRSLAVIFFISGCALSVGSCRENGPADALVTVIDSAGKVIQGAKVILEQDSVISANTGAQANVHKEQLTDFNGQAIFSFPLEAVLNIEVVKGALDVKDYIRLEQSKQVEKTVVLK